MPEDPESVRSNPLGQPIGPALTGWKPPSYPEPRVLEGDWCRLEPLRPAEHAAELFESFSEDRAGRLWTYLSYGPFPSLEAFTAWLQEFCTTRDPQFFAIRRKEGSEPGRAAGQASYLRISPELGSIEVGHICLAPSLQRTSAATEALFLLMKRAFELGYRRFEWKCDSLNSPSRRAALRLGFRYEGTHRQAHVYKGRSRDTAWYSVIDDEWPELHRRFRAWLDPRNFDAAGRQRTRLERVAPTATDA